MRKLRGTVLDTDRSIQRVVFEEDVLVHTISLRPISGEPAVCDACVISGVRLAEVGEPGSRSITVHHTHANMRRGVSVVHRQVGRYDLGSVVSVTQGADTAHQILELDSSLRLEMRPVDDVIFHVEPIIQGVYMCGIVEVCPAIMLGADDVLELSARCDENATISVIIEYEPRPPAT
jgi:hypothetical protein